MKSLVIVAMRVTDEEGVDPAAALRAVLSVARGVENAAVLAKRFDDTAKPNDEGRLPGVVVAADNGHLRELGFDDGLADELVPLLLQSRGRLAP